MRGLGGFVLLAGIGVGLFVYFPAPVDRDTSLEQAQARRRRPHRHARGAQDFHHRAQSTGRILAPCQLLARSAARRSAAQVACRRSSNAPPLAAATKIEPVPSWQTNVVPTAGVGGPSGSLDPTDPESRYKLVVDIQQQLKRVGCYWGRTNGAWNNNTREAMHSFTANTNAALPVDKPDYLLLSLLKSHNGRSCGTPETTTVAAPARGKNEAVAAAQPEVLPWKAGACRARRNAPLHPAAEQRRLGGAAARPHGHRRPERSSAGSPGAAHPWWPHQEPRQVSRVSLPLRSTRAPPARPRCRLRPRRNLARPTRSRAAAGRERRATISC